MAAFFPTAILCDVNMTPIAEVANFRVVDPMSPRGMPSCSFEPPLDFAMMDHPGPLPYVVMAAGSVLRIQLTKWGANGLRGFAEGVIVG